MGVDKKYAAVTPWHVSRLLWIGSRGHKSGVLGVGVGDVYRELCTGFDPVPFEELDECSLPSEQTSSRCGSAPRFGYVEPEDIGVEGHAVVVAVGLENDPELAHFVTIARASDVC